MIILLLSKNFFKLIKLFPNTGVWCLHRSYMLSVHNVYDPSYNLLPYLGCMFFSYISVLSSRSNNELWSSADVLIRVYHRRCSGNGSGFFEWRGTKTTLSSIISLPEVEVTGEGKETEGREDIYIIYIIYYTHTSICIMYIYKYNTEDTYVTMTESICFFVYLFWIDPKNFFIFQTQIKIIF